MHQIYWNCKTFLNWVRWRNFLTPVDKIEGENYNRIMPDEQKHNNEPPDSTGFETGPGDQEEEKDFRIHLSHDGLFRFSFDKKNVVESFVKENLPVEIVAGLDFSTLTPDKDTFVDQKLSRCYSDVLYHIRFRNSPAYLYFLFEHKSWETDFPGLQLLKNMTHIWEKHVEHHKGTEKLPPIIPMVIYHGERDWKAGTDFVSLFDIPAVLEKYIPEFSYELIDVSHMPEEKIKGEVELRIVLMAFRYIFHPEIMSRLKNVFQLFRELTDKIKFDEYLRLLLLYLGSNIKDMEPDRLLEAVTEALAEGGAMMNTVFQQVQQRGEARGEARGEEKNRLRVALNCLIKGMDIQTIAEITDLPVERIELLKAAICKEQ